MVDRAYASVKYEQRRVSVRLPKADWNYFDGRIKFGAETDERAVSWALHEYIMDRRAIDELREKRAAMLEEGRANEESYHHV